MNVLADRLDTAFKALGLSAHKFHAKHKGEGVSRQTLFNMLDIEKEPGFGTVAKVCELEPSISAEYLMRGIGDPVKPGYAINDTDPCAKYKDHIRQQSQQNDEVLSD